MMSHAPILPRPLVFTNGCFDLLHAGHVDNLTRARAQGAYLVVAINSDDSVRALKGPSRPIMPQAHRVAMLSALRCVDMVLVFHAPTPIQLILELRPDVLVKGPDYEAGAIVGAPEVNSWGGRIVCLASRLRYLSTTAIIERIKAS